jgi:Amt family ammonium transporter
MTAGYAALVAALLFRKREDFGKPEVKTYDTGMVVLGTALLWFGWFGFNAGSALAANGLAAQAFATTFFAAAAAMAAWTWVDSKKKGKPSAIGACVGAVAGLVAITPAAGFVTPMAAIAIGLITGSFCNFSVSFLKERLHLDDTLDVFGCHGIGGTIGTLLTGVFATKSVNSSGADGLLYGNPSLLGVQLLSALAVVAFTVVCTFVIIKAVGALTPIQLTTEEEREGLDWIEHGERINSLSHPNQPGFWRNDSGTTETALRDEPEVVLD